MATTISDVAKRADVSISTVSRVINGAPNVDEAIRRKVIRAVDELGYAPNAFAQSLRQNRSRIVGIITTDTTVSFFTTLIHRMEMRLLENSYTPIFANSYDSPEMERNILSLMTSRRVDALVVCSTCQNDALLKEIERGGIPVILYDRRSRILEFPTVYVDKRRAMIKALSYLYDLGHRQMAFITGEKIVSTNYDRYLGIQDFIYDHNMLPTDITASFGTFTFEFAEQSIADLFSSPHPPTAIITGSVAITAGVIAWCKGNGVRIPEDLSLVSFGTFSYKDLVTPSVTYVEDLSEQIADTIYHMLEPVIEGDKDVTMQSVVLNPELVVNASCAAPPVAIQ